MTEVFISYARSTARLAQAAAAALRAEGFGVWFDDDLPTHRPYADVIAEQIERARAVLVLWSDEAARSQWVRSEADRARAAGKLVQARVDAAVPPMPFDQIQCADLAGWRGETDVSGWSKVVDSVAALIGRDRAGAPTAPALAPSEILCPAEPVVAVLPFDDPAHDPDLTALAEGVAEDIILALAKRDGVRVVGRTASFAIKGEDRSRAGALLGADLVLDGSVRRSGARVRIAAHLNRTATGEAAWAERFDGDADDLFGVQDHVAARIAEAVGELLPVRPSPPAAGPAPAWDPAPEGERRHVSVLALRFADGRGSGGADPEAWREALAWARPQAEAMIARFGGHVAPGQGETLIAYFGYPQATEDATERAVRAGLAAITGAGVPESGPVNAEPVVVSAGVDAGLVVVEASAGGGLQVFGDAPQNALNAARREAAVLLTPAARDLASLRLDVRDADEAIADPRGEPLALSLATGEAVSSPLQRSASRFVGRQEELAIMVARWTRAREGEGQSVLISGEPGIGKSRLLEEFRVRVADHDIHWLGCGGEALFSQTPFRAVGQLLIHALDWRGDEEPARQLADLEALVESAGLGGPEAARLLAAMLHVEIPQDYGAAALGPEQDRTGLLGLLAGWIFALARVRPVVLVAEDLHWIDPSSLELVQLLLDQCATARLLVLATARPEFRPPWTLRGHHAQVILDHLARGEARELVASVVAGRSLPPDLLDQVLERTDGVPLFAEELTRLMLEGRHVADDHAIPATLLGSLSARLDRLGHARGLAQLASVIGRDFSYDLVRAVSPESESVIREDLQRLIEAEIIYARGVPPQATYQFKHALMGDAAYEGLLKSRRRALHERVATAISQTLPHIAQAQPELLARHWSAAGQTENALAAWMQAAEAAHTRRAFKEAEEAYRQAMSLLAGLPESRERDERELKLCSAFNRVLQMTQGYSGPETVSTAARAKTLAEKLGSTDELIREEAALWRATITRGDIAGAVALADRILELVGDDTRNRGRLVFAHNAQIQARYYTGDLPGVEEHFAKLSPLLFDPTLRQAPGNAAFPLGIASLAAFLSGRAETAVARIARAYEVAHRTNNPFDQAAALHFQRALHRMQGDNRGAGEAAKALMALSEEHRFANMLDLARGPFGLHLVQTGEVERGMAEIRLCIDNLSRTGQVGITSYFCMLSDAQVLIGDLEGALHTLETALTVNSQEKLFEPDGHRLRGNVLLALGRFDEAEAELLTALDLSRRTGALVFEWRTQISLGRISGRAATARDELRAMLARFPEPPCHYDQHEAEGLLAT